MKTGFLITIEELLSLVSHEHFIHNYVYETFYIGSLNTITIEINTNLNYYSFTEKRKYLFTSIKICKGGNLYPLKIGEKLISKRTFINVMLILMIREKLGFHKNLESTFMTPDLLTYINQS